MSEDDWRNWKNGKYDNRYHRVKRHAGQRNYKKIISIILIVVFFVVLLILYNFKDLPMVHDLLSNLVKVIDTVTKQIQAIGKS